MDRHTTTLRPLPIEPAIHRFAQLLRRELGAERVLLFGSHARDEARADSDYDLIVIAPVFADIEPARRGIGLWDLWYRAGGSAPLDLICVTPEEFAVASTRISLIASVLPDAIDVLAPVRIADETNGELPTQGIFE